ncbi:hypothetical protein JB92DRAFT_2548099, partial [Gautieria morchelliformis]
SPAYEEYQTGVIGTSNAAGESKLTYRVNFTRAFSEPPQVVTCFERFAMASNQPWRLTCKATDIDRTGFTAHINAWGDTFVSQGFLYWFAHPSDRKGVVSGDVTLMDTSTFTAGQSKWSCRVNFPRAFSQPPQVVTCFERFAMASNQPWCLTCKATDIDRTGFTAHINAWGDTV